MDDDFENERNVFESSTLEFCLGQRRSADNFEISIPAEVSPKTTFHMLMERDRICIFMNRTVQSAENACIVFHLIVSHTMHFILLASQETVNFLDAKGIRELVNSQVHGMCRTTIS
ncbi:hypothetical protein CBL_06736 [Carabus blaptoides fortunei]